MEVLESWHRDTASYRFERTWQKPDGVVYHPIRRPHGLPVVTETSENGLRAAMAAVAELKKEEEPEEPETKIS